MSFGYQVLGFGSGAGAAVYDAEYLIVAGGGSGGRDSVATGNGAAGGAGIAALAQEMANQGTLQARQAAASIGTQESAQQELKAGGELIVQRGEQEAMGKRIEGEIMSRDMERNKVMTLMGMSQSEMAAQNQAAAQAEAQMWSGVGDIAGGITSGISMGLTDKMPKTGINPETGLPW